MTDDVARLTSTEPYSAPLLKPGQPIVGVGPKQPIIPYIENSIRQAMRPYVFEPNTPATWATITGLVTAFLSALWKDGSLPGASPEDAFTVRCGLGSTMTAQDIFNGYMTTAITLLHVDPAGPFEITFQQTMQAS